MKPERYRAYAKSTATRSYTQTDDEGVAVLDESGQAMRKTREWDAEDVAHEGKLVGGKAEFDAGKTTIERVVFYGGPRDSEMVLGSVEVGKSGSISVAPPEKG